MEVTIGGDIAAAGDPAGAGEVTDPGNCPATRRRWKHLLPQHWESGIWTWTDAPLTAKQILNSAFNHAWGDFGFSRTYHADLDECILTGLDHTDGIKLSSLISEINDKAGLDVAISGDRGLVWERKGSGLPPLPDSSSDQRASSFSLTSADTAVRVVGERIRVQVCNVELEPDWARAWEKWIDELAWLSEVAAVFELPTATQRKHGRRRRQGARGYRVAICEEEERRRISRLPRIRSREPRLHSRMDLYPRTGVPLLPHSCRPHPCMAFRLSSLDLADSLLCSTKITGDGNDAKQAYTTGDDVEFYPACQAQVIHMGQPLDLLNEHDIRLFYRNGGRNLSAEFTEATDFEVDPNNK